MYAFSRFCTVLVLFFAAIAQGAPSIVGTSSSCTTTDTLQTSCNISHTVPSGTTLLYLTISVEAEESVTATPTWNTSQNFTLVHQTTDSTSNADVTNYVYALVNPNVTSSTITVSTSQTDNISAFAVNWNGTETGSVAAATNYIGEEVNNSAAETNTTEISSGGSTGNMLVFSGARKAGTGAACASNNAGFTELFDGATGIDATADHCYYVAYGAAPSGIIVTWNATDSNAGQLVELVAASASSNSILFYTR